MTHHTTLTSTLREHGYRVTPARLRVWQVLAVSDSHLTADQICERVEADSEGDINLASVYRALALMEELDLVRTSRLGSDGTATWELAHPDEHFHLICVECGSVRHHEGSLVAQIQQHLGEGHGFEVDSVELVVSGRCADCAD